MVAALACMPPCSLWPLPAAGMRVSPRKYDHTIIDIWEAAGKVAATGLRHPRAMYFFLAIFLRLSFYARSVRACKVRSDAYKYVEVEAISPEQRGKTAL